MFSVSRLILSAPRFQYSAPGASQTERVKKAVQKWQNRTEEDSALRIGDGDIIKLDITKIDFEKTEKYISQSRGLNKKNK